MRQASPDLLASKALAQQLIKNRRNWPADLPDDRIWHPATEAEARLLLEEWPKAAELYKKAQEQPNCQPFHIRSMKQQAERILECFRRRGVEVGEFPIWAQSSKQPALVMLNRLQHLLLTAQKHESRGENARRAQRTNHARGTPKMADRTDGDVRSNTHVGEVGRF